MIDGFIPCHVANYTKGRTGKILYLVMHYTGNDGDTAKNNADYYARPNGEKSAHYFVDETSVYQSVYDTDTTWHCGREDGKYKHPACRNANSIGIEMCSRQDAAGNYYIKAETVANAKRLVEALMRKYGIDKAHILRHYDVTGKECPRPWVRDKHQFEAFLGSLEEEEEMSYEKWKEHQARYEVEIAAQEPPWGKETWDKATERNIVDGARPMAPMTRLEYATSELRREGKTYGL